MTAKVRIFSCESLDFQLYWRCAFLQAPSHGACQHVRRPLRWFANMSTNSSSVGHGNAATGLPTDVLLRAAPAGTQLRADLDTGVLGAGPARPTRTVLPTDHVAVATPMSLRRVNLTRVAPRRKGVNFASLIRCRESPGDKRINALIYVRQIGLSPRAAHRPQLEDRFATHPRALRCPAPRRSDSASGHLLGAAGAADGYLARQFRHHLVRDIREHAQPNVSMQITPRSQARSARRGQEAVDGRSPRPRRQASRT